MLILTAIMQKNTVKGTLQGIVPSVPNAEISENAVVSDWRE